MISVRAREKLLSHARFVHYYQALSADEKNDLVSHIESMIRSEGLPEDLITETVSTLQKYLNVDPSGGTRIEEEKIVYHEEL